MDLLHFLLPSTLATVGNLPKKNKTGQNEGDKISRAQYIYLQALKTILEKFVSARILIQFIS